MRGYAICTYALSCPDDYELATCDEANNEFLWVVPICASMQTQYLNLSKEPVQSPPHVSAGQGH